MSTPLRLLMVEDSENDAALIIRQLEKGEYAIKFERVETADRMNAALKKQAWDIVISDYRLPQFSAPDAFAVLQATGLDLPFIVVSGTIGEETAVEMMKAGAHDYLMKDKLARLAPAVQRAMNDAQLRAQRAQAEEELRESEEKFRTLSEQTPNMIFISKGMNVMYVNEQCVRAMGYTKEEFYSPDFDVLSLIPPEYKEIEQESFAIHLGDEEIFPFEYTLVTKNGKRIEAIVTTKLISYENESATLGVITDITERKRAQQALVQSEKRYREVVENASEIIFSADLRGRFTHSNAAGLKISGYTMDELTQLTAFDLVLPEQRRMLLKCYFTQFQSKTPVSYLEYPFRSKSGSVRWLAQSTSLMYENDIIVGFRVIARDISERKISEDHLRNSENRFRSVWENSSDGMRLTDKEGTIVAVNEAYCNLVMATREELVGRSFNIVYRSSEEEDKVAVKHYTERFRDRVILPKLETQLMLKSGEAISVELSNAFLELEREGLLLLSIVRDISKSKESEEALKKSEEKFRDLFDAAPVGYHELDAAGTVTRVNRTELDMLGRTMDEVVGKPVWEFVEDSEQSRKRVLSKLREQGSVEKHAERNYIRKDGTRFPALIDERLLRNRGGDITGMRTVIQDITEKKRAEESLRESNAFNQLLVQTLPFGMDIVDQEGNILFMSDAMKSLAGSGGFEERCWSVYKDDKQQCHGCPLRNEIVFGNPETLESPGVLGGKTFQISHIGLWYQGKKAMLEIFQDISEQKRLQNEVLQSQKIQSIGTLAGGIAHDFNNILGIILGYTSLMSREDTSKEMKSESLKTINQAVQRGSALVRQILTFARKTEILFQPLSVQEVSHELLSMLRQTFPKIIVFKERIEKNLPYIDADRTQLHQALLNLCVNARDAMPDGGTITLTASMQKGVQVKQLFTAANRERYIRIELSDTGTGMDQATRARVFDPFFTTKEPGKGTGLGLSVVYGVMQAHQGFVDVESEPGRGTTFRLYFPVTTSAKEDALPSGTGAEESPGGTETVLIVEDEEGLLNLLRAVMEPKGYKIYAAKDGMEAVELYAQHRKEIDLVISDMGLPKMTGAEEFKRLRELNPKVRVILASGFIEPNVKSEIYKAGVKAFVEKPYVPDDILRKIREVLDEK